MVILSLPPDPAWTLPKLTRWHFAERIIDERLLLETVQTVAPDADSSQTEFGEALLERSGVGGEG